MSDQINIALCRHIKTNGRRCQSPAIKGTPLCFHHRNIHRTHRRPQSAESLMSTWKEDTLKGYRVADIDPLAVARAYPKQNEFHFPALEDAESVQLATSMLFQAIATGQIHFLRAKLLLATLKVATLNMRAVTTAARYTPDPGPIPTEVVRTTSGHILAAPADRDNPCPTAEAAPPSTPADEPSPSAPACEPVTQPVTALPVASASCTAAPSTPDESTDSWDPPYDPLPEAPESPDWLQSIA
jgi:hypothetical protein